MSSLNLNVICHFISKSVMISEDFLPDSSLSSFKPSPRSLQSKQSCSWSIFLSINKCLHAYFVLGTVFSVQVTQITSVAATPRTTNSHTNVQIRSYRACRECRGHVENSDPFYLMEFFLKKALDKRPER